MDETQVTGLNQKKLLLKGLSRFFALFVFLGLVLFLSAGTLHYLEAWIYLGILFIPILFVLVFLFFRDPRLLESRLNMKEHRKSQKKIVKFGFLIYLLIFIIPGLDHRFKYSSVPWALIIIADLMIWSGYFLFFLVLRENSYASRIIQVEKDQKVISSGPYSVIRHPMYFSALLIFFASPLALGSFWGLTAAWPLLLVFILRLLDEERVLIQELPGYEHYTQKVKYRLVPYIW